MITFPKSIEAAASSPGQRRAGGTDVQELRHLGIRSDDLVDLRDCPGLDRFEQAEDGLHLGAGISLTRIAQDAAVKEQYPALAEAAGGLATPQIRNRASLAGSLLQEVRCWYYRHPDQQCAKKGGAVCLARQGDHLYHSCFDTGVCVAPHPSTMAAALWAYDALVELDDASLLDIPTLLGDGTDPRRTHHLAPGRLVVAVHLPPPPPKGELAAYGRAISRARAEWPLAELVVRLGLDKKGEKIDWARLVMGGVANRPLRLSALEEALVGQPPTDETFARLAPMAIEGAKPLPMTGYKLRIIPGLVREQLLRAMEGAA